MALKRGNISSSLNMLWALVGALDPWPEGTDWRTVAAGPQRLPLLLAVERRDQARDAVLEAADTHSADDHEADDPEANDPTTVQAEPSHPFCDWAPGLPFDEKRVARHKRKSRH